MIPRLDRFAWMALLCCAFSVCTTRPIDKRQKSNYEAVVVSEKCDKCDNLLKRIDEVSAKSESLDSRLSLAIRLASKRKPPEIRPAKKDTTEIFESHQSPHGKWFEQ